MEKSEEAIGQMIPVSGEATEDVEEIEILVEGIPS